MIKDKIREFLKRIGVWYTLQFLRQSYSCVIWLVGGGRSPAPHCVKLLVIKSYLEQYKINNFIETGTYLGETLGFIGRHPQIKCISIELSSEIYVNACKQFSGYDNVKIICGDSGVVIPNILDTLKEPALFWLDGHYSGSSTARSEYDTPISQELEAIFNHPIKSHVVLIDDARCFNGTGGYMHLDQLIQVVRLNGHYDVEVTMDIIRLTKRNCREFDALS